ncbi:hypothetical protein [Dermatobacter hominis]|uniref:hypothetical protein n=1 Tax=Dermatobacter hominis TaxID=2884263 RepID=UPI001D1275ED|nr:hypothetical protein [Dermatobacter hominis]UDY36418.1 hypothetical protein LH044_02520 [Dermatobacter hominis]
MSEVSDLEVVDTPAGPAGTGPAGGGSGDGDRGAPRVDGSDGAEGPEPSPASVVLAGLAVPGLDLDEARHLVGVRAGRRLRRRRAVLGGVGAVCAVALGVLLWPHPDPEEINADGDRTTTTTTTIAPATTAPVVVTTVPMTTVPTSTTTGPTLTTVPVTTAPPTTVPPNQVMTASATLVDAEGRPTTTPAAGQAVVLQVTWSDPDVVDAAAVGATADFGDPAITLPVAASAERPPCDGRGTGANGTIAVPFRYATPTAEGASTVIRVEVTACDGNGAYGERQRIDVPVRVAAPAPGTRAVVVGGGDGRSPDAAEVLAAAGALLTPPRVPDLAQVLPDGTTRATVATIPTTYSGGMLLRWGSTCQATASAVTAGTGTVTTVLVPGLATCPGQAGAVAGTGSPTRP